MSEEDTAKKLWEKLGNLYQSNCFINKLFLQNKLYLLRLSEGDTVTEHLNVFNIVISQLLSMDIKITKEEKCIILLCSFIDFWDILAMAIESNITIINIDNVVASLFSEEMRWKNMEGLIHDALMVRGRLVDRGKGKTSSRISNSRGRYKNRSKSPDLMMRTWWKCRKVRNYKRGCKSIKFKRRKWFEEGHWNDGKSL